jgi:hypothetical protein
MTAIRQRRLLINAFYNWASWYEEGQNRLKQSCVTNGEGLDYNTLFLQNSPKNQYLREDCPYTIKAAAIYEARLMGYEQILWADCSIWLNNNPTKIFDIIEKEGFYCIDSGYNCAQTISDKALNIVNLDRDTAESIPEAWSCIFGINLLSDKGYKIFNLFLDYSKKGVFNGSREHDRQSKDKRFLFHRQDQSALSLACYFSEVSNDLTKNTKHLAYLGMNGQVTDETVFLMKGL